MGLFEFFKRKGFGADIHSGRSYFGTDIQNIDLKGLVNFAISVFQDNPDFDAGQVIEKIRSFRDDERLAIALYRFIPIAYIRLFIPALAYPDQYFLVKNDKQLLFAFSTDGIYRIVWEECKVRFSQETSREKILPVLFHSSDFNSINEALKAGSKLENLVLSPPCFV